tara:strand:+ start:29510 stop:30610 length:1101 start_codon:yes stop_codon:yes gene_type:complete
MTRKIIGLGRKMRFAGWVSASALMGAAIGCAPLAQADLPQNYIALLQEADNRDLPADRFLETADMVAVLVEGGRAAVHQAVLDHIPDRAGDVADWPLPEPEPVAPEPETEPSAAPAETHETRSLGEGPVSISGGPGDSSGWLAGSLSRMRDDSWSGHFRAGVQLARGNTDLTHFNFAVELDRELEKGWRIDSQFEYFISDQSDQLTQDDWLVELRASRILDSGIGYYAGGSYERDLVGIYNNSAFFTAGAIWHVLDGERVDWGLRGGVGQRYREYALSGETTTDWVLEGGSSFSFDISDTTRFGSETTAYLGGGSRIDQRFTLTTRIFEDWAVQTALRIEREFEDQSTHDETDARLDVSLLYSFGG